MKNFIPLDNTANQTSATTTAATALVKTNTGTAQDFQVRVYNSGAVIVFINFGTSGVTAVLTTSVPIHPGATEVFGCSQTVTHIAGITASSTSVLYFTCGQGS